MPNYRDPAPMLSKGLKPPPLSLEIQKLIDTGQFDPQLSKLLDLVTVDLEELAEKKEEDLNND